MLSRENTCVTIDGPAASGKGSVAKRVAEALGYVHLDTGKLYRAVGLKLMESGKDVQAALEHTSPEAELSITFSKQLDISDIKGKDLDSEGVGNAASIVSAIPDVREALLAFQREIAYREGGAVLDGRDAGTVVCPDAKWKFFIDAAVEARAERRTKQLQLQGKDVTYEAVLQDLQRRDARDTARSIAPMVPADDAVQIDTTEMSLDDVFNKVMAEVQASPSN